MEDKLKPPSLELETRTDDINGTSSSINLIADDKELTESTSLDSKPATGKNLTNTLTKSGTLDEKPVLGTAKAEARYKIWLRGELVGVAVVVIIVWGLFLLPIVFYHLPVSGSSNGSPNDTTAPVGEMCSPVITYNGEVCRQELSALTSCFPEQQDGTVRIQSDESDNFRPLLSALNVFGSDECKAAALPFLCVYFFGLCDSTGKSYRPSSSQCVEISTGVCAREWGLASNFPDVTLPECSSFPNETRLMESCDSTETETAEDNTDATQADTPTIPTMSSHLLNQTCTCRDGFYCNNGSNFQCFPQCGSWKQHPEPASTIIDAIVIVAAVIGIVAATAVLIISGIRWKKVYVLNNIIITAYQL